MRRDFQEHKQFVEEKLSSRSEKQVLSLYRYHIDRMRDFQHERLIHLIVTCCVVGAMLCMLSLAVVTGELLFLPISLILLILVLGYLIYYRTLENGVQSLYHLTKQFEAHLPIIRSFDE